MTTQAGILAARYAGAVGGFSLDVAFEAPMRGITALFGPSGCGKTTTLRCIAGLQHLSGRLLVAGEVWQDEATGVFRQPHERPVGYVFQEASLFAHLSVRDNLLYGHRRALRTGAKEHIRLAEVVELLGIDHLLDRAPSHLSGGERQRVAVGRALLSQPTLLLMDEPISALDQLTKDEILPYFEALHEQLAIPVLYVSHDIAEIERLADMIVLLDRGRVLATGPLAELETNPHLPLARSPNASVTFAGRVVAIDDSYGLTTVSVDGGSVIVPGFPGPIGITRRLRIRASDVSFIRAPAIDSTILNCLPVRIVSIDRHDEDGIQVNVVAALGQNGDGARIIARITRKSREALALEAGMPVYAQIKSVAVVASGSKVARRT